MAWIKQSRWTFIALVILETLIFGAANAIAKMAYDSITPLWCLTIRFGLAFAVFALLFGPRMLRQIRKAHMRSWLPAAVCMALSYITCNLALNLTTATNVGFLVALPVIFVPIISMIVNHNSYPVAFLPVQCAVVFGLYLLCSSNGSLSFGLGEIFAICASISLAGALVFGQKGLSELDPITVAGTQIGMSFVMSLACALTAEPMVNITTVQPIAWSVIVFLALMSTCLTFFLQNLSLEKLPSTTVSLLLTGEPIFTAAFSYVLLGETLSVMGWLGAIVIVVSVVAATYVEAHNKKAPTTAPNHIVPQQS